jgi:hypothetical protein
MPGDTEQYGRITKWGGALRKRYEYMTAEKGIVAVTRRLGELPVYIAETTDRV